MKVYTFRLIFVENAIELAKHYNFTYTDNIDFTDKDTYIIFGAHDADYAYKLLLYKYKYGTNYIIINSEQPSYELFNSKYYQQLLKVSSVADYNRLSVVKIKQNINPNAECCYFFDFPIVESYKNKKYDIVFVGTCSEYRQKVHDKLIEKYPLKNIYFDMCHKHFDKDKLTELLKNAKIVLNIPLYTDGILEIHRINKALSCGCIVVSTRGKETHVNKLYEDYVHFTDNLLTFDYENCSKKMEYSTFKNLLYEKYNFNVILKPNVKTMTHNSTLNVKFYTCFFGEDNNVAFKIPPLPSIKYKCYYFTNNKKLIQLLKNTNWIIVEVDLPIKDAFDSKIYKCCPHFYKQLNDADFICYFDSKIEVNDNRVISHITELNDQEIIILPQHPFIKNNVWDEYNEAIKQDRYNKQKLIYKKYINNKLSLNFKETVKNHLTTHFIIRKNTEICRRINEEWYDNVLKCGIMCQISFFFIQQNYTKNIKTINTYDGYNYLKI